MARLDKIKTCFAWDEADQARIAELRRWLDSDVTEVVKSFGKQLVRFKDVQPLMTNARFIERLHGVLQEWLVGLLNGTFDEAYVKERRVLGQKLAEIDLAFEDIILLKGLARKWLFELTQRQLGEQPQALSSTMHALDKALNFDLALVYSGYLQTRDNEMERALLNRFLTITGFSRTLYESLADADAWNRRSQNLITASSGGSVGALTNSA